MKIVIELFVTLLILIVGYVGTCQYLKGDSLKNINKDCLRFGRNRIIYLCVGAIINIGVIVLFNTIYVDTLFLYL